MPWVAAAPAIISAVGGIVGGILGHKGKKKEAERQRQFMRWLYDPNRINRSAGQLNPFLAYAMGLPGAAPGAFKGFENNGFAQDLRKIAQGQDISKYLLNQPLHEIDRGQTQSIAKLQGLLGKSGAQGGLANLYALSALGSRNVNRARTMRDYGMWREGQRRADIANLMNQWQQTQNMTFGGANQQAANYINPPSSQSAWGGAMPFLAQAGADIFKAFQKPGSGNPAGGMGSTIQTGGNNQFGNTFGQSGNWFQGGFKL